MAFRGDVLTSPTGNGAAVSTNLLAAIQAASAGGAGCAPSGAAVIFWWRNAGSRRARSNAPPIHASPPEITEVTGLKAAATAPDSASPIRGPPVTTPSARPLAV